MALDLIDGYLAHLRSESAAARTISARRDILTRLHEELPFGLDVACEDELTAWLWRDGWKLSTRATYFAAMSGFYIWAVKRQHLSFNPMEELAAPKPPRLLPRPCTDEQLQTILAQSWLPYLLYAKLAAYAGLRCVEIAQLHREHVTPEQVIVINGKGGKPGTVPTHPVVWEAVRDLPEGPLSRHSEHAISILSAHHFQQRLHLRHVSLHRLRHWFGTKAQALYKDLRVTQELLRHEHPNSTAGYTKVADPAKAAAIAMLPTF